MPLFINSCLGLTSYPEPWGIWSLIKWMTCIWFITYHTRPGASRLFLLFLHEDGRHKIHHYPCAHIRAKQCSTDFKYVCRLQWYTNETQCMSVDSSPCLFIHSSIHLPIHTYIIKNHHPYIHLIYFIAPFFLFSSALISVHSQQLFFLLQASRHYLLVVLSIIGNVLL